MIVHDDIEQGTDAWHQLRCGRATASRFAEIVTPSTLKLSASSRKYMLQKLAEWGLGEPCESFKSPYADRGKIYEAEAIAKYEWDYDAVVRKVAFVTTDDGLVGCSPDGLIDDDGGIEVKILGADNHLDALLSPPDMNEHKAQIQGNLWVCERQYWIRWYWHPDFPCLPIRFERDEKYIDAIRNALYGDDGFLFRLESAKRQLVEMGFTPKRKCAGCTAFVEGENTHCRVCREEIEWRKQEAELGVN